MKMATRVDDPCKNIGSSTVMMLTIRPSAGAMMASGSVGPSRTGSRKNITTQMAMGNSRTNGIQAFARASRATAAQTRTMNGLPSGASRIMGLPEPSR